MTNTAKPFRLFGGTVKTALVHALTVYDEKQSRGARYNPYALPQYFARIDQVCADIENGANPRDAICAAFTGTVLNACLRAIGANKPTHDELTGAGKGYFYTPVSKA